MGIRWFARFKLLADGVDRTGQCQQQVLSQRLVGRQQSGDPVDAGDRDCPGAAGHDRHQTSCGPTRAGGMAQFNTTFKCVTALGPAQRLSETIQGGGVSKIAGGANWGTAATRAGKVVVDHVIWKQHRKLIDRNPIDLRQEIESFFGVRGA